MAIYSLFSATGAPGTTTTAVGLALRWPRNVILVDADPSGSQSIAAGYLKSVLAHDRGLMELAAAARHDQMRAVLPRSLIHLEGSNADFLQGPRSPRHARSLSSLWPAFINLFGSLDAQGTDVIMDLGRYGTEDFAHAVLTKSDRAILTMTSSLPAIVGTNWVANHVAENFPEGRGQRLQLCIIGQGQPYPARAIAKKLQIPDPIPVVFDAATAAHFSTGSILPKRRIGSAPLLRSLDAMISTLRETDEPKEAEDDE